MTVFPYDHNDKSTKHGFKDMAMKHPYIAINGRGVWLNVELNNSTRVILTRLFDKCNVMFKTYMYTSLSGVFYNALLCVMNK